MSEALTHTQTLSCTSREQLEVLERLFEQVRWICEQLDLAALSPEHAQEPFSAQNTAQADALELHLASRYQKLAETNLTQKALDDASLSLAIYRALTLLSHTYLRTKLAYFIPPTHLWKNIHHLYSLAVQQNIQDKHLCDEHLRFRKKTNITEAYKRILLLASSNPSRIQRQCIRHLFTVLESWSSLADIHYPGHKKDLFVIDPRVDHALSYQAFQATHSEHHHTLDTKNLALHVEPLLEHPEQEDVTIQTDEVHMPKLPAHLLLQLHQAWREPTPRIFTYLDDDGKLQASARAFPRTQLKTPKPYALSLGLSATHFFIHTKNQPATQTEPHATEEETTNPSNLQLQYSELDNAPVKETSTSNHDPVWKMMHKPPANKQDGLGADNSSKKVHYGIENVSLLDISPTGFGVCATERPHHIIQPGELVGLQPSQLKQDTSWAIGTIRWVRSEGHCKCHFGIQVIATHGTAIDTCLYVGGHQKGNVMRSLLLPSNERLKQKASIITFKFPYKTGDTIHLLDSEKEYQATLTQLLFCTGSFKQFEFELMAQNH